jgi:integrase
LELPKLIKDIHDYDGDIKTKIAMKFLALTFVRTGELIGGKWSEIDFENRRWEIPAERMKMQTPHIVPLSTQAIALLEELKPHCRQSEYLFPAYGNIKKHMSNNTILFALYRMGYRGKMTGHGFRGVASTILHEHEFPHEHIELQLAHMERNKVSAAYNHATYLPQRAKMMQWWGDFIANQRNRS